MRGRVCQHSLLRVRVHTGGSAWVGTPPGLGRFLHGFTVNLVSAPGGALQANVTQARVEEATVARLAVRSRGVGSEHHRGSKCVKLVELHHIRRETSENEREKRERESA